MERDSRSSNLLAVARKSESLECLLLKEYVVATVKVTMLEVVGLLPLPSFSFHFFLFIFYLLGAFHKE